MSHWALSKRGDQRDTKKVRAIVRWQLVIMTYDMLRALDVEKDDPEDSASEAESVQYVNKAAVYACGSERQLLSE